MTRRGLDRAQVVELAAEIADQEGFENLDLTRLADAAGVRKPSLYKHIDGLPAIHDALAERGWRQLTALLDQLPVHDDPHEDLVAVAQAWRAYALQHPGSFTSMVASHVHRGPEAKAAAEALLAQVFTRVERITASAEATVHLTRGLRALVHGFAVLETGAGFGLPASVDASFERAVRALLAGYGAR